jgi:N-acetylglucosaminyldiphosphoundecaprenol N-acetyl-beta-D-mannosaminyltransferase
MKTRFSGRVGLSQQAAEGLVPCGCRLDGLSNATTSSMPHSGYRCILRAIGKIYDYAGVLHIGLGGSRAFELHSTAGWIKCPSRIQYRVGLTMPSAGLRFNRPDIRPRPTFGFRPSSQNIDQVVTTVLSRSRPPEAGVGLIVTPNIDHIAQLKRNAKFRCAYEAAELILCDGFPVHYYALARGHSVNRVTGCQLMKEVLDNALISHHRIFFVVDRELTVQAADEWAARCGLRGQVMTHVPPFGFAADEARSAMLADEISRHGTTLLVMAVGAPHSEIFVNQNRHLLPSCWAMCVGQAVKTVFGIVQRAPISVRRLHAEWLWRIAQEPRRLTPRYAAASIAFVGSVLADLWEPASRASPVKDPHNLGSPSIAQVRSDFVTPSAEGTAHQAEQTR